MNVKEFYKEMYGEEAKQCVIVEQMQNVFDFAEAYAQHKVELLKLNKHDVSNEVGCNWFNEKDECPYFQSTPDFCNDCEKTTDC